MKPYLRATVTVVTTYHFPNQFFFAVAVVINRGSKVLEFVFTGITRLLEYHLPYNSGKVATSGFEELASLLYPYRKIKVVTR